MTEHYVYCLKANEDMVYIGKTLYPEIRYTRHSKNQDAFLNQILARKYKVTPRNFKKKVKMEILKKCKPSQVSKVEAKMIKKFRPIGNVLP
tara:strand:+ start:237 stop:509 length:273 start_codon:yes stop_codon:yes gene_type:complete